MIRLLPLAPLLVLLLPANLRADVEDPGASGVSPPVAEAAYWFAIGKLLADESSYEEAREAYEKAVSLREDDPYGWLELARFHQYLAQITRDRDAQREHLLEAGRDARQAIELAPEDQDVLRVFAQIHLRLGEHRPQAVDEARNALETLRRRDLADIQSLTQLGQIYLWKGRPDEAAEVLLEARSFQPGHRLLRSMVIDALVAAGRAAEAEEDLAASVAEEPSNLEHRLRWAEIVADGGDHARALEILEGAPTGHRQDPRLVRLRLRELHLAGRAGEARKALEALRPFGDDPGLQRMAIAIYGDGLDYATTRDLLEELVESKPRGQAELRDVLMLARTHERLGESRRAAQLIERQSDGRPEAERLQLRLNLVGVYDRLDRPEDGMRILEEELEGAPDEPAASLVSALAEIFAKHGRAEEARDRLIETADRIRSAQPGVARTLELRSVEVLAGEERWEEVLDGLERLQVDGGEGDERWNRGLRELRARALASSDRLEEALELLSGEGVESAGPRAELLLEAGRDEEALRILDDLSERDGLEGRRLAARVLHGTERYREAERRLEGLVEEEPDSIAMLFLLGAARERLGELESAEAAFRKVLEQDPDHAATLNYLGYMLADRGVQLEEARDLLVRAVSQQPDNGAYVDSLGWVHFRLGNLERARLHLEWAARLVPEDSTVFLHLGEVYSELGEDRRARQAWKKARDLGGEGAEAASERLESD